MQQLSSPITPSRLFMPALWLRLAAALLQGAALYAILAPPGASASWLVTNPPVALPALIVALFAPLVVMLGAGQMRGRSLLVWTIVVIAVLAALGCHDAARLRVAAYEGEHIEWPRFALLAAIAATLFIAHTLVVDGTAERRLFPSYERHFNTAWKNGLQLCLAGAFVGVFWLLLQLGAQLFHMLGLEGFSRLIRQHWFAYPATTLATAVALHITDVQPALIRGARGLVLTLFSWLLPLLTAMVLAFLCCLPFTSLEPLWRTNVATTLLLSTMAALVLLINSHYQDGAPEHTASRIKRVATTVGAILLVPLCGLAIRGLSLRVEQYGWTTQRVLAAAAIVVVICYAVGYAIAAVRSPAWFKRVEITNIATAWLSIVVMLALFSPIADPARLMVANQVDRLRAGAVAADKFDFMALKYDGARWGTAALKELAQQQGSPDAESVRVRAKHALASTSLFEDAANDKADTAAVLTEKIKSLSPGRALPAQFYDPKFWARLPSRPLCLVDQTTSCAAIYITLAPGEPESILLADMNETTVFQQDKDGDWQRTGTLADPGYCGHVQKAMQAGKITTAPHTRQDVIADGVRLVVIPREENCPSGQD